MIISIVFAVIYLTALGSCINFASKRSWIKSIFSMAIGISSFVEAFFASRGFVSAFGKPLSNALKEGFLELLNLRSDVMVRETAMLNVSSFAVTIIISMSAFLIFFILAYAVNSIIKRAVFFVIFKTKYSAYNPQKKFSGISIAMSVVSFLIVLFAILYPIGAASDIACSAAERCNYTLPASVLTNPVSRFYGICGRDFFDRLTNINDIEEFKNSDEAERFSELYIAVRKVAENKDTDGTSIEQVADSIRSSYLITDFTSELVANAANSWKNGRKFMNKTLVMPQGRNGELVYDVLGILSEWQRDNLVQDIDTAINIYKLLHEYGILKINDGAAMFAALAEEEFSEKLFLELSQNSDFISVIPKVIRFGISSAVDAMEMEMNDDYIAEFNASELSRDEWIHEADAFSTLLKRMNAMSDENASLDIAGLLTDLYELRDSKLLSNILLNILVQILYNMRIGAIL